MSSRDVMASYYINRFLEAPGGRPIQSLKVTDPNFSKEVSDFLLETAVYLESRGFGKPPSEDLIEQALPTLQARGQRLAHWRSLGLGVSEVRELLKRKLKANQMIRFKLDFAGVFVMDYEVRNHFKRHQKKFKGASLNSVKEEIKQQIEKKRREEGLKKWFEVLQIKFKVKKFIE